MKNLLCLAALALAAPGIASTETAVAVENPAIGSTITCATDLGLSSTGNAISAPAQQIASGTVFHDSNNNRQYDSGESTLSDVRVSNGRDIVLTDAKGRYHLPVDDDTILFVVKPKEWRTPLNSELLPQFYYIHKPTGSPASKFPGVPPTGPLPASVDFPLYPQTEPDVFKAVIFADPQPRNATEVEYVYHDVVEQLIGTDASFGVTLGDIAFNDLTTFDIQNRGIAMIGIPWYNVIGNHDLNFESKTDADSDETFHRVFGPNYYSFDYGNVHFIALDDVDWKYRDGETTGSYTAGLDDEQMAFIRKDLSLIPRDQMVVLMMHIPLMEIENRQELFRLIEERPLCVSLRSHAFSGTSLHHQGRRLDGSRSAPPHH